ncbi:MAG: pseudouridine synthase [Verrucomicrobiota bacterium]|jgi:23S rRNA pseudouridine2605 synthase
MVRLQKLLAESGVASRRASERIMTEGRVTVNGQIVRELGSKVDPNHDDVRVDGRPVKARRKLYVALHKPKGFICSRQDPLKRRSVYDLLPAEWTNLYTVGRLDFNSEGLIFLTNDGDFSLRLSHPRFGVRKKYLVTIEGRIEPDAFKKLTHGIKHEGDLLRAEQARLLKTSNAQSVLELVLAEGKNREVRRMFEAIGQTVLKLQRMQIGPIKLGELPTGKWRTLTEIEIKSLLAPSARKPGAGKSRQS